MDSPLRTQREIAKRYESSLIRHSTELVENAYMHDLSIMLVLISLLYEARRQVTHNYLWLNLLNNFENYIKGLCQTVNLAPYPLDIEYEDNMIYINFNAPVAPMDATFRFSLN